MDSSNNFEQIEILGNCLICGRPYGDVNGLVHVTKKGEYDFKEGNHGVLTTKNKKRVEAGIKYHKKGEHKTKIRSVYDDRYRDYKI